MLGELLDAAAVGRGRTVFLAGESGVGKTRLTEAAREEVERRAWGYAVGRGYAVETDLPYALFADALLPTVESLSAEGRGFLDRRVLDDLVSLFPALGRLRPGGRSPPTTDAAEFKNRLLWNFAQFLKELTHRTPLLVVLEDLHWADVSSLELLHFLSRQTAGSKVSFLCTYRSDTHPENESLVAMVRSLQGLSVARVLPLEPLAQRETDELVQRVFTVPEAVCRSFTALLYGWTRGNPFFIEEVLKALVETGRLYQEQGVWLGWDAQELALPATIRDTVMLRLGRLVPEAARLAEQAAVLGGRVDLALLATMRGVTVGALVPLVEELRRARILEEIPGADAVTYGFVHPIIRETLYAELGRARAGMLHGMVADTLEQRYGLAAADHAGELAYHFVRALDQQAADKAVRYLATAGRNALAAHADPEAVKYLRAALDRVDAAAVAGAPDLVREIVEALAHAHQRVGANEAAIALWTRARTLAHEAGDGSAVARIHRRLGLAHYWLGDHTVALQHLDAGLAEARAVDDRIRATQLQIARGMCVQELGRGDEAKREVEKALPLARQVGSPALLASVHRSLLLLHLWTGPSSVAAEHGERALALATETGDSTLAFWASWALSLLAALTGDSAALADHLSHCERIADELRSPLLRLWASEIAIEYAFGEGRWDEGLAIGENGINTARALHQDALLPRLLVWTAQILLGRDETERARAYVEEAWSLAGAGSANPRPPRVHTVIPAHIGRASYHLAVGDHEEAIRAAEAGLAVVDASGYDVWAIHRLLPIAAEAAFQSGDLALGARYGHRLRQYAERFGNKLGLAWAQAGDALSVWLAGDSERGAVLLREAAEALEAIPFLPDATRLRRQLAGRLADIGDREGALRELRHVHQILARLGAERELQKAREQFRELGVRPPSRSGPGGGGLTGRELEIARAVARRQSNKAIARQLGISVRTVTTHLSNIFRKLEVSSRAELTDALRAAGLAGELTTR